MWFFKFTMANEMIRKSSISRMLQIGLVLSQFSPGALLTVEAAQVVFEGTFENGFGDIRKQGNPQKPESCESDKFRVASDLGATGGHAIRLWQPGGQECLTSFDKHRAMFWIEDKTTGKMFTYKQHTHYYVGYRMYVPSDFPTALLGTTNDSVIHLQLARNTQGETPKLALVSKDGVTAQLEVTRKYIDDSGKLVKPQKKTVDLVKGEWNSIVFHIKHEYDNTGLFEMWVNDLKVIDWQNVRTASNPTQQPGGTTSNIGLYWGARDRPADFEIYIDDYRVAEGLDGFYAVNPNNLNASPPAPPILSISD